MKMKSYLLMPVLLAILFVFAGCANNKSAIDQKHIDRVETMPQLPEPYDLPDWGEVARNFDKYVFDHDLNGEYLPFIWLDDSGRNFPQQTFGLYTAIGDVRQGPDANNGEFHEAINSLGALLSAGLMGIDKTDQDDYNYVKMVQNYFNTDNNWNIMMNNTSPEIAMLGGGYARDWWYDVFPNVLYYAVAAEFPEVERTDTILRSVAEQFYKADSVLNGDYHYSFFDYSTMEGKRSHIPFQEDAAAGHAYVLLSAFNHFGDAKYLEGAHSATEALLSQQEGRFYEVLMPFGAYVAARLNAEHGASYDFDPILNWTFDGTQNEQARYGWGIINERWSDYDVHGLQGSWAHDGGYAFLMNTFDMAWPLVPLVRYDPRYAETIGKWMVNAANAARLFYPNEIPDENQTLPEYKNLTRNVIAYEGLKKTDHYGNERLRDASPVALGDGPNWIEGNPPVTQFSVYGSAHAGIFGAIINKTDVERILKLDCLATDFYRGPAYPTYLLYNPYEEDRTITYQYSGDTIYLYDVIAREILAENISSSTEIDIPSQRARLIVEIPQGMELQEKEGIYTAGDVIVSYR